MSIGQISRVFGVVNLQKRKTTLLAYNCTFILGEMERICVSFDYTPPNNISSAFAAGSVDEGGAEDGHDIIPSAFFTLLGGADIMYWGTGREHTQWRCLVSVSTPSSYGPITVLSYSSLSIISVISGVHLRCLGFIWFTILNLSIYHPSFATSSLVIIPPYINWGSIALWRIQRLRAKDIRIPYSEPSHPAQ